MQEVEAAGGDRGLAHALLSPLHRSVPRGPRTQNTSEEGEHGCSSGPPAAHATGLAGPRTAPTRAAGQDRGQRQARKRAARPLSTADSSAAAAAAPLQSRCHPCPVRGSPPQTPRRRRAAGRVRGTATPRPAASPGAEAKERARDARWVVVVCCPGSNLPRGSCVSPETRSSQGWAWLVTRGQAEAKAGSVPPKLKTQRLEPWGVALRLQGPSVPRGPLTPTSGLQRWRPAPSRPRRAPWLLRAEKVGESAPPR